MSACFRVYSDVSQVIDSPGANSVAGQVTSTSGPAGARSSSTTSMPVIVDGPVLFTTIVNVTLSPTTPRSAEGVFCTTSSPEPTVSVVLEPVLLSGLRSRTSELTFAVLLSGDLPTDRAAGNRHRRRRLRLRHRQVGALSHRRLRRGLVVDRVGVYRRVLEQRGVGQRAHVVGVDHAADRDGDRGTHREAVRRTVHVLTGRRARPTGRRRADAHVAHHPRDRHLDRNRQHQHTRPRFSDTRGYRGSSWGSRRCTGHREH